MRSNVNNPNRACDPVNNYGTDDVRMNNYQLHTSSEDEDELTQLKPNLHPQKRQQQHKNSKKSGPHKKSNNIGGAPESTAHGSDVNSHNYMLGGGQYEDTASPNGSENAYAEASLLPTSMSNQLNRQDIRYDQGMCETNLEPQRFFWIIKLSCSKYYMTSRCFKRLYDSLSGNDLIFSSLAKLSLKNNPRQKINT